MRRCCLRGVNLCGGVRAARQHLYERLARRDCARGAAPPAHWQPTTAHAMPTAHERLSVAAMAVSAARPTLSAFAVRQELDQDAATDAAPMAASEPFAHAQAARFQQTSGLEPWFEHGYTAPGTCTIHPPARVSHVAADGRARVAHHAGRYLVGIKYKLIGLRCAGVRAGSLAWSPTAVCS